MKIDWMEAGEMVKVVKGVNVYVINRGHQLANQSIASTARGFRIINCFEIQSFNFLDFIHSHSGYVKCL